MNAKKEWGCLIRKKFFVLQGEMAFLGVTVTSDRQPKKKKNLN